MIDYADLSRRQLLKSISVWLRRIDPDEDVLLTEHQVRGILDILSYVFRLEGQYLELVWPHLCNLLLVVASKLGWAGYREDEWIQFLEQGIELAHTLENKQDAVVLGIELGIQYERRGDFQRSEDIYQRCLNTIEIVDDKLNKAKVFGRLAHIAYLQEKFDESYNWVFQGLKITEIKISELAFLVFVQGALAFTKQEYDEAIIHFEQVLSMRETQDAKRELGMIYNDLGSTLYLQKQYKRALEYFNQALLIYEKFTSPVQQGLTQMNIGCIYTDTEQGEESLNLYQSVEEIFHQARDKYKLALLYNNWGWAHYMMAQLQQAQYKYELSIKLWQELGVIYHLVNSMDNLGLVYLSQTHIKKAIYQFENCLEMLQNVKDMPEYHKLYQEVTSHLTQTREIC